ncbi:MAG TPA: class I SAM-dependent methyltransferase [Candidatus Limnocylindria bacterium]
MGAGDGRFVLARAAAHRDELVLAIDAGHAGMRESSWRASRKAVVNALFVASSLERLPPELSGIASLVSVHFPWGTLLNAAIGRDLAGTDRLATLVASGGMLRMLVSAAERDAARGATDLDPDAVVAAYRSRGFEPRTCREATAADLEVARSSWGRRLLSGPSDRRAWLIELRRVESGDGGTLHRVRA